MSAKQIEKKTVTHHNSIKETTKKKSAKAVQKATEGHITEAAAEAKGEMRASGDLIRNLLGAPVFVCTVM